MGLSKADPVGTVIECDSQGNPTIRWAKAPKVGDSFYSAPSIPEGWWEYMRHKSRCEKLDYLEAGNECTCGLDALLSAAPQPGEGKP